VRGGEGARSGAVGRKLIQQVMFSTKVETAGRRATRLRGIGLCGLVAPASRAS
jgi:hypothetical protein